MSEAIKPTPGPWTVVENSWEVSTVSAGSVEVARCYVDCNVTEDTQTEDEAIMNANARLIAEAGTVHHETGLTPSQLVERVKELEEALAGMLGFCDEHGDFRNGVTDPTGAIDEGNVTASRYFAAARAALSKALPNTVAEVK